MAMMVEVKIGDALLDTLEIKRRGPYDRVTTDDSINRYIVRVNDEVVGHVKHRYGNDALTLVTLALDRYREHRAGIRDPYPDE